ncbi:cytochrome d ubiquinol oxidase subunit II [Pullulanibacillus pueri]|uniref:Cytochrome D ubiquinol oxidase subunit II n=1 Tax=Pullulanibacillus pueri TaxID=1437324 RepID=A0A8J2ZRE1_9BACL|nr:cytochrome d ubiquinol oxidase subunit II [Pullulanibacillus pueri]MBM7680066.1 cytochrome d ubiquinol oxidase subunit II [Pullulanibacillus pueri]GGH74201.1 cytochrome D ubiquinol oxidase subunit II [Pullulanibacillus pueri]
MSEWLLIIVLWILLYCYLILASIDFGAGFFLAFSRVFRRDKRIYSLVHHYLSPFWEMTNIIFLFFFIGILSFLPNMISFYEGGFITPSLILLLLLLIRTGTYAYYYYTEKENRFFYVFYGLTGLAIPAVMATGLTMTEGGYLHNISGQWRLNYGDLFGSFYFWVVLLLAVISVVYISLMFMTFYAAKRKARELLNQLKGYVIAWSVPTILASAVVFAGLQNHNPEHFNKALDVSWLFLCSLICLMVAITLVFQDKWHSVAFFFVLLQFFFAFFGYGISHLPYIIYPDVTLPQTSFGSTVLNDIVDGVVIVSALSIPVLILYLRLFIARSHKNKSEER